MVFDQFARHLDSADDLHHPGAVGVCGSGVSKTEGGGFVSTTVTDYEYDHSGSSYGENHHDYHNEHEDGSDVQAYASEDPLASPHENVAATKSNRRAQNRRQARLGETDETSYSKRRISSGFLFAGVLVTIVVVAIVAIVHLFVVPGRSDSTTHSSPSNPSENQPEEDWILVSEIVGSVDSFGFQVDFNEDGSLVAVAAPRAHNGRGQVEVFRRITTNNEVQNPITEKEMWERVGDPIVGDSSGDYASLGMDLSPSGNHLAVGYPGNGNGFVRVFTLRNGKWLQQGQTLAGRSLTSQSFGASVSLANTATHLIVGAPLAGDQEQGMVHVYEWSPASDMWKEDGTVLHDSNPGDRFGSSVEITNNGNGVVVGAPGDDARWEDGGSISFFLRDPSTPTSSDEYCMPNGCWNGVHASDSPVAGETAGDELGQTFVLTSGGDGVVASSVNYNEEDYAVAPEYNGLAGFEERDQEVGVGKVMVILFATTSEDAEFTDYGGFNGVSRGGGLFGQDDHAFGVLGSTLGEGFGYDVTEHSSENDKVGVFVATNLNNESHTGIARAYTNGGGRLFKERGSEIGALPLGPSTAPWQGKGPSKNYNHAGPSVSIAAQGRLAMGYQSVVLDRMDGNGKEAVPGVVRFFQFQPVVAGTS
eukprot:CAMPEP_0194067256 /NCGR_PEP_ID=MMETSP0009_2-20130614/86459_1 /TAXON_ID=210454 /ORGANISM="Grammatophora oceanica, Strain CCMP 410" /LENGTH=645 /DNA_ID=CAMNT_0038720269 /DNA_START=174 /DNA_END=2111 /DNA_ORIENTATION=-